MTEKIASYGDFKNVQKWEHKVHVDKSAVSPEIFKLEQQGWELVTVVYKKPKFYFYFKREKLET
jgi:hypothetical protein